MLMQYWFPFRGCSPFWFVLGLKIEILESCWLQMLCFKRKMKENRLFAFLFCLVRMKEKGRKFLFFFFGVWVVCAVAFLTKGFFFVFSLKAFFFPKEKFPPADLRKCGFYRDSSQNPNFISAVSQTLYRIKEIFLFWFFWR